MRGSRGGGIGSLSDLNSVLLYKDKRVTLLPLFVLLRRKNRANEPCSCTLFVPRARKCLLGNACYFPCGKGEWGWKSGKGLLDSGTL